MNILAVLPGQQFSQEEKPWSMPEICLWNAVKDTFIFELIKFTEASCKSTNRVNRSATMLRKHNELRCCGNIKSSDVEETKRAKMLRKHKEPRG